MNNKETAEEAIKREYEQRKINSDFPFDPQSFKLGAKWQKERMYSEDDLRYAFECATDLDPSFDTFSAWFEQFKKKV